jgi:hypothetical protein
MKVSTARPGRQSSAECSAIWEVRQPQVETDCFADLIARDGRDSPLVRIRLEY